MAAIKRYSVAKTEKSYSPEGVAAITGSTVYSSTEEWVGDVAYPPAQPTPQVPPTT